MALFCHGVRVPRRACRSRRFVIVAAVFSCLAGPPSLAQAWDLSRLLDALRQVRSSTVQFVEMRHSHLLNQPQRSTGRLIYVAPDQLQKVTIEPRPMRLTINGDQLTIERQGEAARQISLHDYSEIGALVESVRATLAGDLPALTRYFATTFAGGVDGWTLTLTPKEARLRDMVATIRISGERTVIRDVMTIEADGDWTDMTVQPYAK